MSTSSKHLVPVLPGGWIAAYCAALSDPRLDALPSNDYRWLLHVVALLSNHTAQLRSIDGNFTRVDPGQIFISTRDLAERAHVSHKVVRNALDILSDNNLRLWAQQPTGSGTVITLNPTGVYHIGGGYENPVGGTARAQQGHSKASSLSPIPSFSSLEEEVKETTARARSREEQRTYQETEEARRIWSLALETLRAEIDPDNFAAWVERVEPLGFSNRVDGHWATLQLGVPSALSKSWIERNFPDRVAEAVSRAFGISIGIEISVVVPGTESGESRVASSNPRSSIVDRQSSIERLAQ